MAGELNLDASLPGLVINDQPGLVSYQGLPGTTYPDSQILQPTSDPQPSYYDSGTSSYSSGPSYTQGVNDPNTLAAYDQGINNTQAAIDRQAAQYQSGVSDINASYQNALNQLLLGKNQAEGTYNNNVLQTKQDYVGGKNTIRSRAGGALNGLLRLLGSRGAGGSSAATLTAPGAVARQATQQQGELGNTFGHNIQNLDQNWGNYMTGYNNEVASADRQRAAAGTTLQNQINTNRAQLLQQLATLSGQKAAAQGGSSTAAAQPYLDQANSLLNSTASYTTPQIAYQTQAYTAPSLDKYTVNPGATPTVQGQAQGNDYTSPYLAALLGKKQQASA